VERRALVGRGPPCPLPRRRDEEHGRGGVTRRRLDVGLDARAGRDELREVRDGGPPLTAGPGWTAVTRTATEETHPAIVASGGDGRNSSRDRSERRRHPHGGCQRHHSTPRPIRLGRESY